MEILNGSDLMMKNKHFISNTMNIAEECLKCLQNKNWTQLNTLLSDNQNSLELAESPTFNIFENILVDEIKRYESEVDDGNNELFIVVARIFQIHEHKESSFEMSASGEKKIARYLFDKNPQVNYAEVLTDDIDAQEFLKNHQNKVKSIIDTTRISANLNVKVGEYNDLVFDKEIFNSPQEKELFIAARKVLPDSILLPNTALSTIIDSKICKILDPQTATFFYKSTLDLCIVNSQTFYPELFIELDSSWHDIPKNNQNDIKKDKIFKKAGLKLYRLRKKENKDMAEIFELFINENYVN
ncbi:DUF2726 domain-containing protein [Echinicola vietnamensis]|nr:DUF2726 domain-containing protein [Echinicola vietnamensis]